jgi:hypothetical protein
MIALLILTRRRDIMGSYASGFRTVTGATAGAAAVLALNLLLVLQTVGIPPARLGPSWLRLSASSKFTRMKQA